MALTRKTIHDDIDSLCSHLGLDPEKYHNFPNDAAPLSPASPVHEVDRQTAENMVLPGQALLKTSVSDGQLPHEIRKVHETIPVTAAPSEIAVLVKPAATPLENFRKNLHVMTPLNVNGAKPQAALPASVTPSMTRWPSLRGLGGRLAKQSDMNTSPIAFHPVGGGVGLTTVMATTAKALGLTGQRVLVADDTPRSTLPFFFGAHDLLNGTDSLIVSNGIPTYLLLRGAAPEPDASDEWLWSKAAQLDTNIDVLLMEASAQMAPRTQTWVYSAGVSIFVLEPDMRSAMALPQTLEMFAARQARFAEPVATYFVLNKYDEESPFSVDMRRWLQDELAGMLAPVVLRRDYRVSEALAQGKTVLDYAPESEIAQDFREFAQWLSSIWKH